MEKPFTGGCACGALRYHVQGKPSAMLDCQCRQCQKESGTGHASHVIFTDATVEVEGSSSHWETIGDGGLIKRLAFCPTCGSPVYMTLPQMQDQFILRAASLDEPDRYRPQMVLWTQSAQPWDKVDTLLPTFPKMPPPGA